MAFCWSTIHVKDFDESLKFYTEIVGLSIVRTGDSGPMRLAFLGEVGAQVELIGRPGMPEYPVSDQISLGFTVESLDEKIVFLKEKGIDLYREPFQPNPTIRFCYIKDPNGVNIQFVENIKQ
jgi:lactoylglutathione lyase